VPNLSPEQRLFNRRASARAWKRRNPELVLAAKARFRARHRAALSEIEQRRYQTRRPLVLEYHREQWKSGITQAYRMRTKEARAGRPMPAACEACHVEAPLNFDHDHATGEFRGWICGPCNRTLGHARENSWRLCQLASYIDRWKQREGVA
jgi:hypothetical protein